MTPLEYATNNGTTIGQLFFLAWRTVTHHSPAREDCKAIIDDWNRFTRTGDIPRYVEAFLLGESKVRK